MAGMIIGATVIYALFFLMCYLGTGTDQKNMASFYSYPDAVQDRVRADAKLKTMIPKEKPLLITLFSNVILFFIVFVILGLILNIRQFLQAFCYFLIVGEGLNLFDLIVIDMCWWRNTSRTKFKAIPDKALYCSMKKHVATFLRGIPVFLIAAAMSAGILSIIPAIHF